MTLYVLSYIIFSQIYEDEFINFSDELIFFTYCHAFMKKTSLIFSFLICFFTVNAQEYFPVNGIKDINNAAVILTNATVHVDAQETLENCDVLIKEGKIVSVGSKLAFPKNTISYNLSGKHIYCSFIDVYSSFGIPKPKKAARPKSSKHDFYPSSKECPHKEKGKPPPPRPLLPHSTPNSATCRSSASSSASSACKTPSAS